MNGFRSEISTLMTYFSSPERPVNIKEFLDFWVSVSPSEKRKYIGFARSI